MNSIQKSKESKVIDARKVAKAVKLITSAHDSWEDAKERTVRALAEMNDNERADWLDQVIEKNGVGINLFKRMAAVASRGWIESKHLYGDYGIVSHVDILCASEKAAALLKVPSAELAVANADGTVMSKPISKLSRSEMRRAWHHQRGQIKPENQDIKKKKIKAIATDGPAKVIKAKKVGDNVEITVDGFNRAVTLTKNDVKNLIGMVI